MKVLIAVASKHGSTREIARAICEELQAADFAVDILDLAKGGAADVRNYHAVIVGSAIYAGNWLPEAKQFAQKHRDNLASLPVWLFSSGPLGSDNPQPHDDPEKLALSLGHVKIREHHLFLGKLDTAELGFGERLMVKMVHAPGGDFRDWEEVSKWGKEIARQLRSEVAAVNTPV